MSAWLLGLASVLVKDDDYRTGTSAENFKIDVQVVKLELDQLVNASRLGHGDLLGLKQAVMSPTLEKVPLNFCVFGTTRDKYNLQLFRARGGAGEAVFVGFSKPNRRFPLAQNSYDFIRRLI